jgi:hypothetical protein
VRPGGTHVTMLTAGGYKSDGNSPAAYKPSSDMSTRKTWTVWVYEDGRVKKLYGCQAKIKIPLEDNKKVTIELEFEGIWGGSTDAAMPSQAPIATAPYIFRGVTVTVGGVTPAKISKITVDLGAQPEVRLGIDASTGVAHFLVTEITPTIEIDPEARKEADQGVYAALLAGATAAFSCIIPSASHSLTISAPAVQRTMVKPEARGKLLIDAITLQCCNSSGDDALSISEN